VVTAVVLGAVGVCGLPSASAVGNVATSTKAYRATVASDSAVIVATDGLTYRGGKESFSVTTMGSFSWSQDQGELNVSEVGSGSTFTTQEIVDGNETYSTSSTTGLPAGDTLPGGWTETTWRGHDAGGGLVLLQLAMFGFGFGTPGSVPNPKAILGLLGGKAIGEERLGNVMLDGVDTSHFRSSMPFSSLGFVGASTAEIERDLGSKSVTVDYWTDSSDRLRLMRFSLKISHIPERETTKTSSMPSIPPVPITASIQLQVSDYGTPVTVTPPPSNEITSRSTCEVSANSVSCST
jgi:hypothetical protein